MMWNYTWEIFLKTSINKTTICALLPENVFVYKKMFYEALVYKATVKRKASEIF